MKKDNQPKKKDKSKGQVEKGLETEQEYEELSVLKLEFILVSTHFLFLVGMFVCVVVTSSVLFLVPRALYKPSQSSVRRATSFRRDRKRTLLIGQPVT